MKRVITREEMAALLQEMAEAKAERLEYGQAKKLKPASNSFQSRSSGKVQRWHLMNPPQ